MQIDTRNILFICGGAFDGLEQALESRANAGAARLGFLAGARNTASLRSGPTPLPPMTCWSSGSSRNMTCPS